MLGRALLFPGSTFHSAVVLVAIQSVLTKTAPKARRAAKKTPVKVIIGCALQGQIFVFSLASLERYRRAGGQGCPVELIKEPRKIQK